uniref:Uncharacterized protein n=1 Tax=Mesocestoides corti TaxID=53468 RepID=A0A5K3FU82_MESCO
MVSPAHLERKNVINSNSRPNFQVFVDLKRLHLQATVLFKALAFLADRLLVPQEKP